MKYLYSSMAIIGITAGLYLLLTGRYADSMLTLIFGAVCLVAAEVSDFSEKFKMARENVAKKSD